MKIFIVEIPSPYAKEFEHLFPRDAEILSIQKENGRFCLHCLSEQSDLDDLWRWRKFLWVTNEFPEDVDKKNVKFIGSIKHTGILISHLFEKLRY